ncbi:MAG TPA: hypothetical protein VK879_07450 [Candidatus Sulfomarinibacteraceae bacterium]|nr:hypothetical protein [Candidatus Sulfomarinibacteraceae bacterium]
MRDLALVRRLSEHGIRLDAESALTRSYHPLRGALFGMIGGSNRPTYVWRSDEGDAEGFVQLRVADDLNARLICLAVDPAFGDNGDRNQDLEESAWLALLDDVVRAIGRRGIHSLIAEVDESGAELITLRRAGFAVFTRQDIWLLQSVTEVRRSAAHLKPRRSVDDWDIEWLYANTVPPLIQLVEPSPPFDGDIWLLREEGELSAFAHIAQGSAATWMQIFIHPNAHAKAEDILNAAVSLCAERGQEPVYCCVRRYQSWIQGALESSGFTLFGSQAVMVRHMSKPAIKKVGALERLLNAQSVRPTTLLQRCDAADEEQKLVREDGV